jgi:hypothetical protein
VASVEMFVEEFVDVVGPHPEPRAEFGGRNGGGGKRHQPPRTMRRTRWALRVPNTSVVCRFCVSSWVGWRAAGGGEDMEVCLRGGGLAGASGADADD